MEQPAGIYLVFGEDSFLVKQGLDRLLAHLRAQVGQDLAIEVVDCKEVGPAGAIEEILAPSLFSVNKVTVLKYFQLSGQSRLARELETCLATGLAPGQFLVLVPDKIDRRLRIVKAIDKAGGLMEFPGLSHEGLVKWIVERCKEEGKTITSGIAETMIDLKGEDDLRAIDSEIDKIITYLGDRKKVTAEDVDALVGRSNTETAWSLLGHVAEKRVSEALGTLSDLIRTNESPIGIVLLLSKEIRWLIQIRLFLMREKVRWRKEMTFAQFRGAILPEFKAWVESSSIPPEATFVRQNPYAAYRRFTEASGFELADLMGLLRNLLEANTLLVSTSIRPQVILERFVASLSV